MKLLSKEVFPKIYDEEGYTIGIKCGRFTGRELLDNMEYNGGVAIRYSVEETEYAEIFQSPYNDYGNLNPDREYLVSIYGEDELCIEKADSLCFVPIEIPVFCGLTEHLEKFLYNSGLLKENEIIVRRENTRFFDIKLEGFNVFMEKDRISMLEPVFKEWLNSIDISVRENAPDNVKEEFPDGIPVWYNSWRYKI